MPGPVHGALPAPRLVQRKIGRGHKARFMRPAFGNAPLVEQLIQPLRIVVAKARMQHQVRTAGDHVDAVDLQQAHACDGIDHIVFLRARLAPGEQALRRQVNALRLRQAQCDVLRR